MTDTDSGLTIARLSNLTVLSHPLLGNDTRSTIWSLFALTILLTLVIGNRLSRIITIGGKPLETVTHSNPVTTYLVFSSVTAFVIGVVTAAILITPFVYAGWNGGPVMTFVIPVAPIAVSDLLLGRYVFDLDWAIAVTIGVSAAALAIYVDDVRRTNSLRPWSSQLVVPDSGTRLQFVTVLFIGTVILIIHFVLASPERIVGWYSGFAVLLFLPGLIVSRYWIRTVRSDVAAKHLATQTNVSTQIAGQESTSETMDDRNESEVLPRTGED